MPGFTDAVRIDGARWLTVKIRCVNAHRHSPDDESRAFILF
jgi:hypothetical protein